MSEVTASENYITGYATARGYQATEIELENLREFHDAIVSDWQEWFEGDDSQAYTPGERLFFTLDGQDDWGVNGDRGEAQCFWDQFQSAEPSDPNYVQGFAEGVLDFGEGETLNPTMKWAITRQEGAPLTAVFNGWLEYHNLLDRLEGVPDAETLCVSIFCQLWEEDGSKGNLYGNISFHVEEALKNALQTA